MDSAQTQEILRLYNEEHLSQKLIAYRMQMTQQNISRIIKKTQISTGNKGVCGKRGVLTPNLKAFPFWRWHKLHFIVKPYYFYPRYHQTRQERGNSAIFEGDWKINLYADEIELILRRGYDFQDRDKFEAMRKAQESLNRTLYFISKRYGFEYVKEGRITIKLCASHLARTNSGLAKARKGDYLQVKGLEGKVWFIVDKSPPSGFEHEYTSSGRFMSDSETIERFLNDLRENPGITISGLYELEARNTAALSELTIQIKKHLEVLDKISQTLDLLQKNLKQ